MKTPIELAEEYVKIKFKKEHESLLSGEQFEIYTESAKCDFLAGYEAAQPKWISVDDELPKDGTHVLCLHGFVFLFS